MVHRSAGVVENGVSATPAAGPCRRYRSRGTSTGGRVTVANAPPRRRADGRAARPDGSRGAGTRPSPAGTRRGHARSPRCVRAAPLLGCLATVAAFFAAAGPAQAQPQGVVLDAVLSCPADHNDPSAPLNPPPPAQLADRFDGACRIYLSALGTGTATGVVLTLRYPTATLDFVSPSELPDGDLAYGVHTLDVAWFNNNKFITDVPMLSATTSEVVLDVGDLAAGSSIVIDVQPNAVGYNSISVLFPEGTWEITLDVASTNAALPPQQVAPVTIPHAEGVGNSFINGRATVTEGLVATSYLRVLSNPMFWPPKTHVTIDVYLPYRDTTDGSLHADGLYDPTNPHHVLLVDPAAMRLDLTHFAEPQTYAYFPKPPGATTGPPTGPNAGAIMEWVAQGGFYRLHVGSLVAEWSGVRYSWRMEAAWASGAGVSDGEAIPLQFCYHAAEVTTPQCYAGALTATTRQDPTFWVLGAGVNNPGHLESNALQPTGDAGFTWRLSNEASAASTGAFEVVAQVPGIDGAKNTTFSQACFSRKYDVLPWVPDTLWAIDVSTATADYGSTTDLTARTVPSASAQWVTCIPTGPKPYCCRADDLVAQGIDPASVQEVRFRGATVPAGAYIEGSVSVSLPAVDSTGNENPDAYVRTDATGAATAFKATASVDVGGTAMGYADTDNWEIGEHCSLNVTRWSPATADGASKVQTAVGESLWFQHALYNGGVTDNIRDSVTLCGTAPAGWSFTGNVKATYRAGSCSLPWWLAQPWPLGAPTATWDPATRQLCLTLTFDPDPNSLFHTLWPVNGPSPAGAPQCISLLAEGTVTFDALAPPSNGQLAFDRTVSADFTCDKQYDAQGPFPVHSEGDSWAPTAAEVVGDPSLWLEVSPSQSQVGLTFPLHYALDLHNRAYLADGTLDPNGARAFATDVAVYHKVTHAGDYAACAGGNVDTVFHEAVSADAQAIWVTTAKAPPRGKASATLDPTQGWILCAERAPGDTGALSCNPTALVAVGVTPAQVEWVAFALGEVQVTDAAPRSGTPGTDVPYHMEVTVQEAGTSDDGAFVCTQTWTDGANFLETGVDEGVVVIQIDTNCTCEVPGDGIDNDCDGIVDETTPDPCNDGNACTAGDAWVCDANGVQACVGTPVDCDDGDACTADVCEPATGCAHPPATDGTPCDDGDPCTGPDTCQGGACTGGPPTTCDDNNPCTDDACDTIGGCSYVPNTAPCDDGDPCTAADTCQGGACAGTPLACDDGDACTEDVCACATAPCDAATACLHLPLLGAPCDDEDLCTASDACTWDDTAAAGVACHGVPVDCDDGLACTTDACDPATGTCTHAAPEGTAAYDAAPGNATSTACWLPVADLTNDGAVFITDVQCTALTNLWVLGGATTPPPVCIGRPGSPFVSADFNCDGAVNVADALLSAYTTLGIPLSSSVDADGDGCPDACKRDSDNDGAYDSADCAPLDPAIGPCAPEVCNGVDDNCDGIVDGPDAAAMDASCDDHDPCNGMEGCAPPVDHGIRITEVMLDPTAAAAGMGQWVEIHNGTLATVDVHGWRLESSDGSSATLWGGAGSFPVPSGHYLLVATTMDPALNGGLVPDAAAPSLTLPASSGGLTLRDASGAVVDTVAWDAAAGWPLQPGTSLALADAAQPGTAVAAWAASTQAYGLGDRGTPGGPNADVTASKACTTVDPTPPTCDDGDGCTTDTCAGGGCVHTLLSCDDGDACTSDACAAGACTHTPIGCDDGDACTNDSCSSSGGNAAACGGCATAVAVGHALTCIRRSDATLWCNGWNAHLETGTGMTADMVALPAPVQGIGDVAAFDAGGGMACAVDAAGQVTCWGLLPDDTADQPPTPVGGIPAPVVEVSVGDRYACFVTNAGDAYCWSRLNNYGTVGSSTACPGGHCPPTPVLVDALAGNVASVGAGYYHTCAVGLDGLAYCWGRNTSGEVGVTPYTTPPFQFDDPVQVSGLAGSVVEIGAGVGFTCARLDDGTVWCWGDAEHGQLGTGQMLGSTTCTYGSCEPSPTSPVTLSAPATHLAVGGAFACALLTTGAIECWGDDVIGQLGDGGTGTATCASGTPCAPAPIAVPLPPGRSATSLSAGTWHACAVLDDGQVLCWGQSQRGSAHLGLGSNPGATAGLQPAAVLLPCPSGLCEAASGCQHDPVDCDDGIACTVDACDPASGCTHTADAALCDDGQACTADACDVQLGCTYQTDDPACDDGIACTVDTCAAFTGCAHAPDDAACDDGLWCTDDACNAASGCTFTPNDAACDDGDVCTTDACQPTSGAPDGCTHAVTDPACENPLCTLSGAAGDLVTCPIRVAHHWDATCMASMAASLQLSVHYDAAQLQFAGLSDPHTGQDPLATGSLATGAAVFVGPASPGDWAGAGALLLADILHPARLLDDAWVWTSTIGEHARLSGDAAVVDLVFALPVDVPASSPAAVYADFVLFGDQDALALTVLGQAGVLQARPGAGAPKLGCEPIGSVDAACGGGLLDPTTRAALVAGTPAQAVALPFEPSGRWDLETLWCTWTASDPDVASNALVAFRGGDDPILFGVPAISTNGPVAAFYGWTPGPNGDGSPSTGLEAPGRLTVALHTDGTTPSLLLLVDAPGGTGGTATLRHALYGPSFDLAVGDDPSDALGATPGALAWQWTDDADGAALRLTPGQCVALRLDPPAPGATGLGGIDLAGAGGARVALPGPTDRPFVVCAAPSMPSDQDGDFEADATDCAPADAARHHGAAEVCNGLDDDCDGLVDEGLTCP